MPRPISKKVSSSHTSTIDVAEDVVKSASKLDCVSKIVLGVIRPIKGPPASKSIKMTPIPAGIRVKVRGPKSVQELFIYTRDRLSAIKAITQAFEG